MRKVYTATREVAYDQEHVTVYYHEGRKLVETVWHGFANSGQYREAMMFCLRLALEKKSEYWIADRKKMRAIRPVDQEWTVREVAPMYKESKLRKVALITSTDIFNQMASNAIHVQANHLIKFESKYFTDTHTAHRWIGMGDE